jgi:DNA-binding protein YbaB
MSASRFMPSVQKMLDNDGIYVASSTKQDCCIVIVSGDGKLFSTQIDDELAPDSFLDDFILKAGPIK